MKPEEKVADEYLKSLDLGNVTFEPNRNAPPDFAINDQIGVEVRRLNQHYFAGDKPEGLEQLNFRIWGAFVETLELFDDLFQGESYLVTLEYKRPLRKPLKEIKLQMKDSLASFLRQKPATYTEMQVNEQIKFYIGKTKTEIKRFSFRQAGET